MSGLLWRAFERVAAERPGVAALIQGETSATFEDLRRTALRLAGAMSRRGVSPGDRCLVYAGNSAETAAAILAVWRLDGIVAESLE